MKDKIRDTIAHFQGQIRNATGEWATCTDDTKSKGLSKAIDCMEFAITALEEMAGRIDGTFPSCEICAGGEEVYSTDEGDHGTARIIGNKLVITSLNNYEMVSGWEEHDIEMFFELEKCPWCGGDMGVKDE